MEFFSKFMEFFLTVKFFFQKIFLKKKLALLFMLILLIKNIKKKDKFLIMLCRIWFFMIKAIDFKRAKTVKINI